MLRIVYRFGVRLPVSLHCIDKKYTENLYSILDQEIIEINKKHRIIPKKYEIYQKYHPKAGKDSAEAIASKNLKDFLEELENYLKEKNPEIFQ